MTGHVHAAMIQLFATYAAQMSQPHTRFEWCDTEEMEPTWQPCPPDMHSWNPLLKFRVAPRRRTVTLTLPPRGTATITGDYYYVPTLTSDKSCRLAWNDDDDDRFFLEHGLVFDSKDHAEAAADALLHLLKEFV